MTPERRTIEISWDSLWRIFFFGLFVAGVIAAYQIVLGLFLAIVISSGLDGILGFLERRGIPRALGVILTFLVITIIIVAIIYTVLPLVVADINTLLATFNKSAASYWLDPIVHFNGSRSMTTILSRISGQLFSGDVSPVGVVSDIFGSFGLLAAVIVSSFYLSLSKDGVRRFLLAVLPLHYEQTAIAIYERARRKISFWIRTQVILSFVVGILTWAALYLLGVRHALVIGIVAAVLEIVPFVGPILTGAIAVLSAFATSSALAFYTLLIFLGIQQFEGHILVPIFTRRSVGLHPVVVIMSILLGIELGGFLGVVVAVPIAAVIQELVDERVRGKASRLPEPPLPI